jgi:hypothetical protein
MAYTAVALRHSACIPLCHSSSDASLGMRLSREDTASNCGCFNVHDALYNQRVPSGRPQQLLQYATNTALIVARCRWHLDPLAADGAMALRIDITSNNLEANFR